MFNKFKVNSITVHYITSSPTSQAGDVLFYYEKDRSAPMPDYSNSSFLPYTLSDPHTVIGPQWTNHSAIIKPTKEWKTTLYGNQTDINEDAEGTLFFFSKTSSASSPGYLLIDYDISFRELSVNPRAGTLPVARAQSSFVNLSTGGGVSAGTQANFLLNSGNTISGSVSQLPNGYTSGDIYKVRLQVTASQQVNVPWAGTPTPTASTLFRHGQSDRQFTIDDGTTLYLLANNSNVQLHSTLEGAVTNTDNVEFNVAFSSLVLNICAEIQLVRNVTTFTQSSY